MNVKINDEWKKMFFDLIQVLKLFRGSSPEFDSPIPPVFENTRMIETFPESFFPATFTSGNLAGGFFSGRRYNISTSP